LKLLDRAETIVEQRTAVMKHVLENKDVDFFWGVYVVPDRLMHRFWAYQDPDHPLYDGLPDDDERRDALRNHLRQLDEALGGLRDALQPADTLMIVSDHGFQPLYQSFNIHAFLMDLGYLEDDTSSKRSLLARLGLHRDTAKKLFDRLGGEWLLDHTSKRFRLWLKQQGNKLPDSGDTTEIDQENSTVTVHNSGLGLKINTERRGGPVPDDNYAGLRDEIADNLRLFMDDHDIAGYVQTRDEFLSGPHIAEGPDIVYFMENVHPYGGQIDDRILKSTGDSMTAGDGDLSAWHHPDGIYLINGPDIQQGTQDASIYDVLPTAMHMLGGKIPADTDGTVLDIFTEDSSYNAEPEQGEITPKQTTVTDIDF
jgi:predicted AlkP superfamily phosphohydrolase/phosphomutase